MARVNDTACTLLGFLHDRPMAGWDLAEAVRMTIGNFWNVTRSQIYRELRSLEEQGFVIGGERGARDKREYDITDAGREVFREWISREPGEETARYPLLISVWFQDHLPDEQMDWFLRVHRARHAKNLEFYQELYDATDDHTTPAARALRFGLFYEEAIMRWFESLPNFGGVEEKHGREEPRPSTPASVDDPSPRKPGTRKLED